MIQAYGLGGRLFKAALPLFLMLAPAHAAAPSAESPTAPHRVRLLTLGDSLTAGYGLPHGDGFEAQLQRALDAAGHPVEIIDGGVSGDTSAGGAARLDWVLAAGADAALVELGANDGLRGIEPADTEANLARILDQLRARHIPVLLAGMEAPPNLGAAYAAQFRAMFARLRQRAGVAAYDPFFLAGVIAHPALLQPDHMHPNRDGVAVIVQRLLPQVMTVLRAAP